MRLKMTVRRFIIERDYPKGGHIRAGATARGGGQVERSARSARARHPVVETHVADDKTFWWLRVFGQRPSRHT